VVKVDITGRKIPEQGYVVEEMSKEKSVPFHQRKDREDSRRYDK
jgi:hypothetical protein